MFQIISLVLLNYSRFVTIWSKWSNKEYVNKIQSLTQKRNGFSNPNSKVFGEESVF